MLLKDGFAGCMPAVRRPTYKPQKGRQRFPVGADSISARGGSRRRALSSGRGPGMPGPYRDAAIFLREAQKNSSVSKKVCSPLGPLCEGAPPAGGGGENCTVARNISGYGKVLSLRPFGAPPSQREVFRQSAIFLRFAQKNPPPSGAENDGGKTQ